MPQRRWLSVTGVGCLGSLLGSLCGVIIALVIALGQFDSDFKNEVAKSQASLKKFEEELALARKHQGKTQGITESLGQGAGNGVAAGLSPFVAASFYFLAKVIAGGVLGLVGGTAFGAVVGTFRRGKRKGPDSVAIDDTPTHTSGP
jgi:hypothetical protein